MHLLDLEGNHLPRLIFIHLLDALALVSERVLFWHSLQCSTCFLSLDPSVSVPSVLLGAQDAVQDAFQHTQDVVVAATPTITHVV